MVDLTHWGGVVSHNGDQRGGEETPELHLENRLVFSREEGTGEKVEEEDDYHGRQIKSKMSAS